ncbi:MAG: ABC transporter permease [candidate division Zixibacteria bacterium]|nr:ABC transporter permease [candidate division Zixibacteria bacterium]
MIRFLFKGVLRDPSRSVFPLIAIVTGVAMVIAMKGVMLGVMDDMIRSYAVLDTGHIKVVTQSYAEMADIFPIDLGLTDVDSLIGELSESNESMFFTPRIRFGGLVDIPDEDGETKAQSPAAFMAVDLLSPGSRQIELLNLEQGIVSGSLPDQPDEILVTDELAGKLGIGPGDIATFVGTTMFGSMTTYNFHVAGTVVFGISAIDKGFVIIDIEGARDALDMTDSATEILGFFNDMIYAEKPSLETCKKFNELQDEDEFAPLMMNLRDQNNFGLILDRTAWMTGLIAAIFIGLVAIVLWNSGLMSGLKRHGEIGIRLAMGETKRHVYNSLLIESLMLGVFGTIIGTAIGLALVYYLQEVGLNYQESMEGLTLMMSNVMRGKVTTDLYFIGILPGIVATLIGTAIAGRAIYKREMSRLFKELEA